MILFVVVVVVVGRGVCVCIRWSGKVELKEKNRRCKVEVVVT